MKKEESKRPRTWLLSIIVAIVVLLILAPYIPIPWIDEPMEAFGQAHPILVGLILVAFGAICFKWEIDEPHPHKPISIGEKIKWIVFMVCGVYQIGKGLL